MEWPMINIQRIFKNELDYQITEFAPIECLECNFDKEIPIFYYLVKDEISSESDYLKLKDTVKTKLGYSTFCEISSELGFLISVSKCPICGSEEIIQDY